MDEKTTLETFFKMMIVEEQGAEKKYRLAEELASPALKKVFQKLAAEEAFHAQLLESELLKLEKK